jgi:hypothetical protein
MTKGVGRYDQSVAGTRTHRLRRCGTEVRSRTQRNAAADKAFVMYIVECLVEGRSATSRKRTGGTLDLTLATGEIFRLGTTSVTRIL